MTLPKHSTIYLAGPMRNRPLHNRLMFNRASRVLQAGGYTVVNPAQLDLSDPVRLADGETEDEAWPRYMARDLPYLCKCDAVFLLPGWDQSQGALLEAVCGYLRGKPLYAALLFTGLEPSTSICKWRPVTLTEVFINLRVYYPQPGPKAPRPIEFTREVDSESREIPAKFCGPTLSETLFGGDKPEDAEVETLPNGGRQSKLGERMDLLPPRALLAVGQVLSEGSTKYGEENWRRIPVRSHVNHALRHVFKWLVGDPGEDHLSHAACRMLMALDLALTPPVAKSGNIGHWTLNRTEKPEATR